MRMIQRLHFSLSIEQQILWCEQTVISKANLISLGRKEFQKISKREEKDYCKSENII